MIISRSLGVCSPGISGALFHKAGRIAPLIGKDVLSAECGLSLALLLTPESPLRGVLLSFHSGLPCVFSALPFASLNSSPMRRIRKGLTDTERAGRVKKAPGEMKEAPAAPGPR